MTLIATRFFPPRWTGDRLSRACSKELLGLAENHQLVLVKAPAGYGKTTLMAECYWKLTQRQYSVAWVSLAGFDGSTDEAMEYLVAAFERTIPSLQTRLRHPSSTSIQAPLQDVIAELCNKLRETDGPLYLFLDDFHAVARTDTERLFELLLRDAPDNLHFVTASRAAFAIPTGRLRALGAMAELGDGNLRFSRAEAEELFSAGRSVQEAADLAALAVEKTEGWPAALQLLNVALRGNTSAKQRLDAFSGTQRDIASFLTEDVLSRLEPDLQEFMLHTAILDRFCPSLCDAIWPGGNSAAMIETMMNASLFVVSLDAEGKWFRYHQLLSEYLRDRLLQRGETFNAELHMRASRWFAAHALIDEALQHAIAGGQPHEAARLLDSTWESLHHQGRIMSIMRWCRELPDEVLDGFPRLRLAQAWYLTLERRFAQARAILDRVDCGLQNVETTLEADELHDLRGMVLHRRMMLAKFQDDVHTLQRLCEKLLQEHHFITNLYLQGTVQLSLLYAMREQYRLSDTERLNAQISDVFLRAGDTNAFVIHHCIFGPALVRRGELKPAIAGYRQALEIAQRIDGDPSPITSMPALLLAEALLERSEFNEARSLYERYLPQVRRHGFVDNLIAGYVGRARLAIHEGDRDTAEQALADGFELAVVHGFGRLLWHVVAERMRQCLLRNDSIGAARAATDAGLPTDPSSLLPTGDITPQREAMAIAWIRLALATGKHGDALRVLRPWLSFAEHRGCVLTQLRMTLLSARAQHALGKTRAAQRLVQQAILLAANAQLSFCFLEEGEPIRALMAQGTGFSADADSVSDHSFLEQLTTAFAPQAPSISAPAAEVPALASGNSDDAAAEPLSAREIEILRLAERSMLGKEIADHLNLTHGTVKWYMQQIYDKLGARRRLVAIQRARSLGYLR